MRKAAVLGGVLLAWACGKGGRVLPDFNTQERDSNRTAEPPSASQDPSTISQIFTLNLGGEAPITLLAHDGHIYFTRYEESGYSLWHVRREMTSEPTLVGYGLSARDAFALDEFHVYRLVGEREQRRLIRRRHGDNQDEVVARGAIRHFALGTQTIYLLLGKNCDYYGLDRDLPGRLRLLFVNSKKDLVKTVSGGAEVPSCPTTWVMHGDVPLISHHNEMYRFAGGLEPLPSLNLPNDAWTANSHILVLSDTDYKRHMRRVRALRLATQTWTELYAWNEARMDAFEQPTIGDNFVYGIWVTHVRAGAYELKPTGRRLARIPLSGGQVQIVAATRELGPSDRLAADGGFLYIARASGQLEAWRME